MPKKRKGKSVQGTSVVSPRFTYRKRHGHASTSEAPEYRALFIIHQQVGSFDLNDAFVTAAYETASRLFPRSSILQDVPKQDVLLFNDLCNTYLAR